MQSLQASPVMHCIFSSGQAEASTQQTLCQDTELDNDVGDRALVLKHSMNLGTAVYVGLRVGCSQHVSAAKHHRKNTSHFLTALAHESKP